MVKIVNMMINAEELLAPLFTHPLSRRLGFAVTFVMILAVLLTIIHQITLWQADIRLAHLPAKPTHDVMKNPLSDAIAKLPDKHLFGQAGGAKQSAALPVTSLQLRLLGVIKKNPDKYSHAIISEAGSPGKIYQIGDTLSSGVTVYAVTENSVILENEGRFEKLPLQRTTLPFQGMPKPLLKKEE